MMRITQQDIAQFAQVSQSTVSRVVSGDTKVDPEIRDRVLSVMREKSYAPDARARQLRSKRANLIGLVLKRSQGALAGDPFFADLTSEILDTLSGTQFHLCLDIAQGDLRQSAIYEELLRSRRVDGLILVESEAADPRLEWLAQNDFPFVVLGNPPVESEIHSVDNDNVAAGRMATQHLLDEGFQRMAFIAAREGITVSDDRIQGFRAVAGDDAPVIHADFGPQAAREATVSLLRRHPDVDSLVVLDDFMAYGAVQASRAVGRAVGKDLGIISFNDSSLCDLIDGGLSSVSLDMPRIVEAALGRLIDIIEQRDIRGPLRQVVPTRLVARRSTAGGGKG